MIVCVCRVVSDRQIKAMAANGASAGEIMAACGAGTSCGACRPQVEKIVADCRRDCGNCPRAKAEVASPYLTPVGEAA